MSLLQFIDVNYANENKSILEEVSFCIEQKDYISIVGPSGSGKSTFLKLCSHLISPSSGEIKYNGKPLIAYDPVDLRKMIAYCFQTPLLFGSTVLENIYFSYQIRSLKLDRQRVDSLFSRFHMSMDILNKEIKNLSGGEKQRIALIRSLLFKPEILLLDEVTSALDVENTKLVEKVITSLNNEGVTVLWVTHNPEQSRRCANKLLTIEAGRIKSLEVLK